MMKKIKINKKSIWISTLVAFAVCIITLIGTWYLNKKAAQREVIAYKDMIISGVKAEKDHTEQYMHNMTFIVDAIKAKDDLNAGPLGMNSIHLQWVSSLPKDKIMSALVINLKKSHANGNLLGFKLLRNIDDVIYYSECINAQYAEYRSMIEQLRIDWSSEFSLLYKTILLQNAVLNTDKKERIFFSKAYDMIMDCIQRDELYRNIFGINMPMTVKKTLLIDRLDSLISMDNYNYQKQSIVPIICSKNELNLIYLNFQASKKYSDNISNHLDSMKMKHNELYHYVNELDNCRILSFWKIK